MNNRCGLPGAHRRRGSSSRSDFPDDGRPGTSEVVVQPRDLTAVACPGRISEAGPRTSSRVLSGRWREDDGVIERAGPNDLMQLASDVGPVPMHIAAIVLLDPGVGFDLDAAVVLVGQRLGRLPRLRQRLVRPAFGCGPAYWLDDATFDPGHHIQVTGMSCPRKRICAARHGSCPRGHAAATVEADVVGDLRHGAVAGACRVGPRHASRRRRRPRRSGRDR